MYNLNYENSYMLYTPPWHLTNGLLMTLYAALRASQKWENFTLEPEPIYQEHIFIGANGVPIFGKYAIPANAKGTIVGTYGITGDLDINGFSKFLDGKHLLTDML